MSNQFIFIGLSRFLLYIFQIFFTGLSVCVFFLQGQEEKIIFISTVLTRPESLKRAQAGGGPEQNIGFLSNAKRFNVAITRAKVVNQTQHISFSPFSAPHIL